MYFMNGFSAPGFSSIKRCIQAWLLLLILSALNFCTNLQHWEKVQNTMPCQINLRDMIEYLEQGPDEVASKNVILQEPHDQVNGSCTQL